MAGDIEAGAGSVVGKRHQEMIKVDQGLNQNAPTQNFDQFLTG